LYATARDFGKLGKLILQEGMWNGKQLIPKWYVNQMAQPSKIDTEEGINNYRYGWHIWIYKKGKRNVVYCRGIKGQYIILLPEKNVVIVRIGMHRQDNYSVTEEQKKNKLFMRQAQYKIGHPTDFFEYLRIGEAIADQYMK
jgi:CubicO group peptidase (beta-lactamase class C family)